MTWFHLVLFVSAIVTWLAILVVTQLKRFNSPSMFLEKTAAGIIIRQYPISRILRSKGKVIAAASVTKVQHTKGCLTIFQESGRAFDIWISAKFENDILAHAKATFPTAEYVRV